MWFFNQSGHKVCTKTVQGLSTANTDRFLLEARDCGAAVIIVMAD